MLPPLSQNQAKLVRSLQIKKYRDREKLYWIEGTRLCYDALQAGANIIFGVIDKEFNLADHPDLETLFQNRQITLYNAALKSLADTQSPQGVGCVVSFLDNIPNLVHAKRLVLLDSIGDPGNLGTIIRTAEWFGYDGIITGKNSVDIYNPKVVRSTMGAIFNIPFVINVNLVEYITQLKSFGFKIAGSVIKQTAMHPPQDIDKLAILIGSEANGTSPDLHPLLDYNVIIPGTGKSESLNAAVAAGIMMHTLNRE